MATAKEAREQLSHDIGDDLEGRLSVTLTSNGTTTTAVSAEFLDFDEDELDTEKLTLYPENGTNIEEERKGTLSGSTFTATRAWSNSTSSGDTYSVHRLFTASEKDNAITQALKLLWPTLFIKDEYEFTEVANQYEYDISSAGFYRNIPRQLHLVSEDDTELQLMLFDWSYNPDDGFLKLGRLYGTGRTYRAIGHKQPTLSTITDDELLIVTARAAVYLYDQAIQTQRVDFVGRYDEAKANMIRTLADRTMRFAPSPIAATRRFSGYRKHRLIDKDWSTP